MIDSGSHLSTTDSCAAMGKKITKRKSKNHLKGPAKRTEEDDRRFEESFRRLIHAVNGEA